MKLKHLILPLLLTGIGVRGANCQSAKPSANVNHLTFRLTRGQRLANIYSRAIAYSGDDFAPLVYRVSGSSTYEVLDNNPLKPKFNETDLYDGRPESKGVSEI